MSTPSPTRINQGATATRGADGDIAENFLRQMDESTKDATGISLLHILTLGSIGASIALFFSGKRMAGIFVGLWPPLFRL